MRKIISLALNMLHFEMPFKQPRDFYERSWDLPGKIWTGDIVYNTSRCKFLQMSRKAKREIRNTLGPQNHRREVVYSLECF